MSLLFDKTAKALGSSLDMRLLRQNVTNANIANAETPGYAAKKVDFEDQLVRALKMDGTQKMDSTNTGHYPDVQGSIEKVKADVYDNPDGETSVDGNTVDLEKEMSTLAENTILYKAAVELIRKKLGALQYAVTEGR